MAAPLVIAHRGASSTHPENTVAAFRAALAAGADWVELDVRRTADGALVVHHDAALRDGRVIADLPVDELPAAVPTLPDALDACAGMGVNIEIKNSPSDPDHDNRLRIADAVAALIGERGDHDRVIVSSFHLPTADRVRAVDPAIPTAWLTLAIDEPAAVVERAVRHGHGALHPWAPTVDTELVDRCHEAGLRVNTWTVDDPAWMQRLADMGIDGIVTNNPALARRTLDFGL